MEEIKNYHHLKIDQVLKKLKTSKEGLAEKEASRRLQKFGPNKIPEEKPFSVFKILLNQFKSPLVYILAIAGLVTLFIGYFIDTVIIFIVLLVNALLGFSQEYKASKTLLELKKVIIHKSRVFRDGHLKEKDSTEIVPGDIVAIEAGERVGADGRLIETHGLKINEASLTGEWLPQEKEASQVLTKETPLADRSNMAYQGTVVTEGKGIMIVTAVGENTEIGRVAKAIKGIKEEKTPLQKKVAHTGKVISIVILAIVFLIFLSGVITGRDIIEMFLTAVAVAVAAIPEGLPVAVTVILVLGMRRIMKKKGLVRSLLAAETLGTTSVICTDKTGTLTEAKMRVKKIFILDENKEAKELSLPTPLREKGETAREIALKIALVSNEAFIENPEAEPEKLIIGGRPTDKALTLAAREAGLTRKEIERRMPKIAVLSFDPVYKYAATLLRLNKENFVLFLLGAPEIVLERTGKVLVRGKEKKVNKKHLRKIKKELFSLTSKEFRVLGTAFQIIPASSFRNSKKIREKDIDALAKDLTFVSLISLYDPLRPETKKAIELCKRAGMRPLIVTGDHKLTARAVAKELGLRHEEKNILEGKDLKEMSQQELSKVAENIDIYARVEPLQKTKIIETWQKKNAVVAMTGDGINDAPALKKADIGIALGSGTAVAKEASDLTLLNDNFSIIVKAVSEGRVILDNIKKVITYLLSDSLSEIVLIGTSILFALPLPILPAQILWINLIEDGLPNIALAFEKKEKDVMRRKPEKRGAKLLDAEMKTLIFIIGIATDLILLGVFLFLLKIDWNIAHIRTIIFALLTIDSLAYVFSCKSLRKNIWQINPFSNRFLTFSVVFGWLMLLIAIYLPVFQTLLKTVPLSLNDWLIILALGILDFILIEATKYYFIKKPAPFN